MLTSRDDQPQLNEPDDAGQVGDDPGERRGETRSSPLPTPYLSQRLCAVRRLDLLMSRQVPDVRIPVMPPFC
jgi:hypothetical protein